MSLQFSDDIVAQKFLALCEDVSEIKKDQFDTRERLFGSTNQPGAIHFLKTEIDKTNVTVEEHARKFQWVRGAVAVLAFLWTAAGIAFGILFKRH